MCPPSEGDAVMGHPSGPGPLSSGQGQTELQHEMAEKYKSLKRRFFELEEEPGSSGERNVRMKEEQDHILEKLQELEQKVEFSPNGSPMLGSLSPTVPMAQHSSSALPRTLQNPKARSSFVANLRQAIAEGDADDDADPLLTSRHLGPQARRREEDERREIVDEDTCDGRKRRASFSTGNNASTSPRSRVQTSAGPSGATSVNERPSDYNVASSSARGHPYSQPATNHYQYQRQSLSPERQPSGGDVEMQDSHGQNYSYSRHSANYVDERQTTAQALRSEADSSTRRETRSSRNGRGNHDTDEDQGVSTRRSQRNAGGSAIAAVAAAAAEAEAAVAVVAAQSSERIPQSSTANQDPSQIQQDMRMREGGHLGQQAAELSTTTHTHTVCASSSATSSSTSLHSATESSAPYTNSAQSLDNTPSMESIVKVAEAAVAAQNAAKMAAARSSQSNTSVDPNLDPSLFSGSNSAGSASSASKGDNNAAKSGSEHPSVNTISNTNATASSSTGTPTSSLSNNPYLSLSSNLLPRAGSGSATPTTGHPMLMPYPLFYPPGTPVTPNTPTYMSYNPYYYLAAPMVPGPNGMYAPAPPGFAPPAQQRPPPELQRGAKPKRLKAHTVTTKSYSIPMVPRDKKGKPMLPLNVGIMTVINLGDVCMREHFHTERYIFPVGYEVTRRYLSTIDPSIEVVYHCTILDGGDGPKFQIIPSDRPDKPIIAGTATGAWSNIVKQANAIRNRQHSNSVSGPDFFGLGQNTIKHLIQELPNADRLRDYVWQNFVEGGPLGGRHAAVIPALPEEYDASMPIGAYYPRRDATANLNVPRGLSHYPQHIIAQAEAQKAQKAKEQSAGPSGSAPTSSLGTPQQGGGGGPSHNGHQGPPGPGQIMLQPSGMADGLTIQEYQPPQGQSQAQSISQGREKRATRSSTAANSASSASARPTRSASRGNQQQQQQQHGPAPVGLGGSGPPSLNADGSMPTTFAGIMNAYPVPGGPTIPNVTGATT